MSSVSSIRLSGLASGIDTDEMIKSMMTADQDKIDKAGQKQQTITWQQEIYREVISEARSLTDKYFSLTSKNSIISSSAWNTLSIDSSNSSMMSAKGNAGASDVNYTFEITNLAEPATIEQTFNSKTEKVGPGSFDITLGDGTTKTITLGADDTVETMIKSINDAMGGKVKASYSEMTKKFTIKTTETGTNASIKITNSTVGTIINTTNTGKNMAGTVKSNGVEVKDLSDQSSNSFTIDNIEYNIYTTGTSNITSKEDYQTVVDNMNAFVEDYNKLMDKVYDLVTQKTNKDYPPLTEAQKEDMSEEEIEKWEEKAKQGLLRNDSEMRRFMDNMQTAIFGDNMALLNEMGLGSHENYNKKGQISLDQEKFIKALGNNAENVYETFAGSENSVFENMKTTMNNYIGGSSSIFAKKAGLEKTASFTNNYYSEQLKNQADIIKRLQNKFSDKETALYKKFANLESSMNKLNNQMNYFSQF
ncbi:flagellar filament capping protein FliD [Terrisporobacter vanillatitrophus]|uniref:flagellar filament capping protein FliD n=1 Tax=Terrisporobacter vanillatitrophus TaxID=3058402 RepID=UPI003368F4D8